MVVGLALAVTVGDWVTLIVTLTGEPGQDPLCPITVYVL